jgi:hypothetical protein
MEFEECFKNVREVLLIFLIKCCVESGKAKYVFSQFFSNDFDSHRDGNL